MTLTTPAHASTHAGGARTWGGTGLATAMAEQQEAGDGVVAEVPDSSVHATELQESGDDQRRGRQSSRPWYQEHALADILEACAALLNKASGVSSTQGSTSAPVPDAGSRTVPVQEHQHPQAISSGVGSVDSRVIGPSTSDPAAQSQAASAAKVPQSHPVLITRPPPPALVPPTHSPPAPPPLGPGLAYGQNIGLGGAGSRPSLVRPTRANAADPYGPGQQQQWGLQGPVLSTAHAAAHLTQQHSSAHHSSAGFGSQQVEGGSAQVSEQHQQPQEGDEGCQASSVVDAAWYDQVRGSWDALTPCGQDQAGCEDGSSTQWPPPLGAQSSPPAAQSQSPARLLAVAEAAATAHLSCFTPGDLNRVLLALVRMGCLRQPPLQPSAIQQQGSSTVRQSRSFWDALVAATPQARLHRLPTYLLSTMLDCMAATRCVCKASSSNEPSMDSEHIVGTVDMNRNNSS
jgi:hypothetical protein